ncbi:hypothetical protein BDP27DRAFT_1376492 [Rhodocollybia butyracea]|uniref:Uncharacterized protein n=1 Tax=Rhodocollybia butyracea TaxID=206335 RepID=A0A9P5TWQ1_9AGAR|nr:hypothetical protein BDP27DRAFT_1376492 [Rhodocollybia butyracea]
MPHESGSQRVPQRRRSRSPSRSLRFQLFVKEVKRHLTREDSETTAIYIKVITDIAKIHYGDDDPGDYSDKVGDFFENSFPVVLPRQWGPQVDGKDTIWVRQEVIQACEDADSIEQVLQVKMILLVIILHELGHTLVEHIFPGTITPGGVGDNPRDPRFEEIGWEIENKVFGFHLLVEWFHEDCYDIRQRR